MIFRNILIAALCLSAIPAKAQEEAPRRKTKFSYFAEATWQQQINSVDISGAQTGLIGLPSKSNIGLSVNTMVEKRDVYLRLGLGLLQQYSGFTVTDPEQHTVLYQSNYSNSYTTFKAGLGLIAKRWGSGSRLGFEITYNALFSNNSKTDVVLIKQSYMQNGQPREDVRAYIDYDYGQTESPDLGVLSVLGITPMYQTRPLFGRSALRLGLDLSTKIGVGNRYGTTNAAQVAIFKGSGDRTIIAQEKYIDRHLTIGLVLGLTF